MHPTHQPLAPDGAPPSGLRPVVPPYVHPLVRCRRIDQPDYVVMLREDQVDWSVYERVPE